MTEPEPGTRRHESMAPPSRPLQYRAGRSVVHRLGAGWKLLGASGLGMLGLAMDGLPSLVGLVLIVTAGYAVAGLAVADLWKDLRWLLLQGVLVAGLTIALRGGDAWIAGTRTALQLVLFFLPVALVLRTTATEALLAPLRDRLPERLGFALGATLRLLPMLAREASELVELQRRRGARLGARDLWHPAAWRDGVACVLFPMTVRAIELAGAAAEAAEMRGVGRTSGGPPSPRPRPHPGTSPVPELAAPRARAEDEPVRDPAEECSR